MYLACIHVSVIRTGAFSFSETVENKEIYCIDFLVHVHVQSTCILYIHEHCTSVNALHPAAMPFSLYYSFYFKTINFFFVLLRTFTVEWICWIWLAFWMLSIQYLPVAGPDHDVSPCNLFLFLLTFHMHSILHNIRIYLLHAMLRDL